MIVVDYSAGRIAPNALKAAGVVGVIRYVSWAGLSKIIHKPEYDELVAAGLIVTLNWEGIATDWLGGGPAGLSHALSAVAQAKALGYPKGREIIGSADFDMTPNQWSLAGRAYAIAFANTIRAAGYRPGVYGPYNVLQWVSELGIMDVFWQAGMSWRWTNNNKVWPGAHLFQHAHLTIAGTDTDYNDILITPLWGKTTMKGSDEMLRIAAVKKADGSGIDYYIGNGIFYTSAQTGEELSQARAEGAVDKSFTHDGDWKGHVGRNLAGATASPTTVTLTQEQVTQAFAANVDALATALASHVKVS